MRNMNRNNMDNLDNLSNDELRTRLLQYGFPNVPITVSTRKVLIKKLRNHLDTEKQKLRRETTYATRYSSGEDSDQDYNNKKYNSRNTVGGIPSASNYNNKKNQMMPPPIITKTKRSNTINNNIKKSNSVSPSSKPNIYVSDMISSETDEEDNSDFSTSTSLLNSMSIGNASNRLSISPISNISTSRYSSLSNNIPTTTTGNRMTISSSPISPVNVHNNENSPYLSDFTRRLLKLRDDTVKTESIIKPNNNNLTQSSSSQFLRNRSQGFNENDIVYHAYPRQQPSVPFRIGFKSLFQKLNNYGIKQPIVPYILVTGFIIFFIILGFMYLTISPDIVSNLNKKDTTFSLCQFQNNINCIKNNEIDSSLSLLRIIVPELERRAIQKFCEHTNVNSIMTTNDIIKFALEKNPSLHVNLIISDIKNIAYLIKMNSQWRIDLVDREGTLLISNDYDDDRISFSILNPKLPKLCVIKNKLWTFFTIVGGLSLLLAVFVPSFFFIKFILNIRQTRRDQINLMMNDIVTHAVEAASSTSKDVNGNKLIVLNHLRDKIIPPSQRKELEKIWNEAIRLLETNESRLQFEIHIVNGEECKAIKWIDSMSQSFLGNRSMVKKWQSPAFDNTNKIANPPTPCLKIRQMFDKFEANDKNLKTIIQDSILEKVGTDCKVYDIQLDTNSCCVYVRCETPRDAGIVHDEINGWWFDNRLVSIKFVRLERYLNRFPKSKTGPSYLRPSNTKKLSISQCDQPNQNDVDDDDEEEDDDLNDNLLN